MIIVEYLKPMQRKFRKKDLALEFARKQYKTIRVLENKKTHWEDIQLTRKEME